MSAGMGVKADELKERCAVFAERVVALVRQLPASPEGRRVGGQLLDAATSVAANYRAACRARSRAEFIAKIGVVVEEIDESEFWLSFLIRTGIASDSMVRPLLDEANQLLRIFVTSHKTASARSRTHQ
jgi:four helix bundle protein